MPFAALTKGVTKYATGIHLDVGSGSSFMACEARGGCAI
jgi:hypothetical protein